MKSMSNIVYFSFGFIAATGLFLTWTLMESEKRRWRYLRYIIVTRFAPEVRPLFDFINDDTQDLQEALKEYRGEKDGGN